MILQIRNIVRCHLDYILVNSDVSLWGLITDTDFRLDLRLNKRYSLLSEGLTYLLSSHGYGDYTRMRKKTLLKTREVQLW